MANWQALVLPHASDECLYRRIVLAIQVRQGGVVNAVVGYGRVCALDEQEGS